MQKFRQCQSQIEISWNKENINIGGIDKKIDTVFASLLVKKFFMRKNNSVAFSGIK